MAVVLSKFPVIEILYAQRSRHRPPQSVGPFVVPLMTQSASMEIGFLADQCVLTQLYLCGHRRTANKPARHATGADIQRTARIGAADSHGDDTGLSDIGRGGPKLHFLHGGNTGATNKKFGRPATAVQTWTPVAVLLT